MCYGCDDVDPDDFSNAVCSLLIPLCLLGSLCDNDVGVASVLARPGSGGCGQLPRGKGCGGRGGGCALIKLLENLQGDTQLLRNCECS